MSALLEKIADATRLRVRRMVRALPSGTPRPGFFDEYKRFYETSITNATPNRLNERYRAMIGANESIIRGRRLVDIASHDGRWTFAACAAGAAHVIGIEARPHLVDAANQNLREYGVSADRFNFVQGDVFEAIDSIPPDTIDTVCCFGFFYHTLEHMVLLRKIAALRPRHVIIDTNVDYRREPLIRVTVEEVEAEADAVAIPGLVQVLAGTPTRAALERMMASLGWSWNYYDWLNAGIKCWNEIADYHDEARITVVAATRVDQR